jgi:NTP pyrophosphatase (non-canonical NTP hydrolase)
MPPPKWEVHQRFVDLVEEVGELANAIQTEEGYKSKSRKKSDLVDSICDVLYEIFSIAAFYNIDLDKEYPKVLKEIDGRRKKGDFDQI